MPVVTGVACGSSLPPRGQVVIYLDTDAPIAVPEATSGSLGPVALFDRVRIEIFAPGDEAPCAECVREVAADATTMRARRFSFGFLPPPRVVGYRARLRLFRSAGSSAPRPASTVELVGYLPAVAEEGIVELTATFHADDVGRPRGTLASPILFDRGAPLASAEGSWPPAQPAGCQRAAPEGSVCVAGGAFFAGDPRVTIDGAGVGGASEHLVTLAPFFLDTREVTVADVRASGLVAIDARGRATDPKDDGDDTLAGACDYTTAPGPWESRPVDCVSWQLAQSFCRAKGGDLPTETQIEIVASLHGTALAPWGDRDPACGDAVVARGLARDKGGCSDADPFAVGARLVPEPAGSGALDRVPLPTGVVLDLGANLSEWTRESFATDDEPCWAAALLHDPICEVAGRDERSVKGGNLRSASPDYAATRRAYDAKDPSFVYPEVGFRCAYPDGPSQ